ncbi:hypothetical protein HJC23_013602 [Cyclotella cryptica]|uniref:Uncharacterized protein n=1 Tax=Cyclotella cryptica TaxID=29204 RepID=A0ABD3PQV6_9STRA|eukprot:CCRYP_012582-RA/>CCRYP_012582-RA protein AED:0.30 eAED:0.30 QI:0/-1/0/1/-1/1/1/0/333
MASPLLFPITRKPPKLISKCSIWALLLFFDFSRSNALSANSPPQNLLSRRDILTTQFGHGSAATIAAISLAPFPAHAATTGSAGLASKLSRRDPSLLKNSVFNIPPGVQVYPAFLCGDWEVTMKFRGFLFPSTSIPKERLIKNVDIPGFQKLSIAMVGDVGRDEAKYKLHIDENSRLEDRTLTLQSSIHGHLGYDAVREVIYDAKENPNRISIDFIPQRTRNANRIELFCNARESELVTVPSESGDAPRNIFVCSEYIRQVTFGLSQEFGLARQVVGDYAHFWTWRETENKDVVTGNLLTAAYLDAQDPMFFEEPSKPVVVYSHDLVASRVGR